jgi:hypothetical protein
VSAIRCRGGPYDGRELPRACEIGQQVGVPETLPVWAETESGRQRGVVITHIYRLESEPDGETFRYVRTEE